MTRVPIELASALEAHLDGVSGHELAARAARISEGYRADRNSNAIITDETDAAIYALTRLPATAAALERALETMCERVPDYRPQSVLDVGAGPGTASLIASAFWPDADLTLCDAHPQLLALARQLLAETATSAKFVSTDLVHGCAALPAADLVIASYALTEIDTMAYAQVAEHLWNATAGMLVVLEPGRPRDFVRLMEFRAWAIGQGAHVVAPCPHALDCPLTGADWCHFSIRLPRSRVHKRLKTASLGFEDEKFSYLVLARPGIELEEALPRVLAPPDVKKHETRYKLCETDGQEVWHGLSKRDPCFSQNRRVKWGDNLTGLAKRS